VIPRKPAHIGSTDAARRDVAHGVKITISRVRTSTYELYTAPVHGIRTRTRTRTNCLFALALAPMPTLWCTQTRRSTKMVLYDSCIGHFVRSHNDFILLASRTLSEIREEARRPTAGSSQQVYRHIGRVQDGSRDALIHHRHRVAQKRCSGGSIRDIIAARNDDAAANDDALESSAKDACF
jgi:hypothetical protein